MTSDFQRKWQYNNCQSHDLFPVPLLPNSGKTLALAEPEARLYNHPTDPVPSQSKCLYWIYLSHFSTDWAEILYDCYLGGKDEVCRQNLDPAALQYSMQRCRISNRTITQPFLSGLSWNLAWLLLRCKQSILDTKQWPCITAVLHAALKSLMER